MQAPTLVLSGTFRLSEGGQRLTMGKFNELVRDNAALNIDVATPPSRQADLSRSAVPDVRYWPKADIDSCYSEALVPAPPDLFCGLACRIAGIALGFLLRGQRRIAFGCFSLSERLGFLGLA